MGENPIKIRRLNVSFVSLSKCSIAIVHSSATCNEVIYVSYSIISIIHSASSLKFKFSLLQVSRILLTVMLNL